MNHSIFIDNRLMVIHRTLFCVVVSSIVTLLSGCFATWGHLSRSDEAQKIFTEHRQLDGFNYYYRGFESQPDAILVIDDAYSLTKSYWKPIASSASNLAEMVGSMQYNDCAHMGSDQSSVEGKRELTGFAIVAPNKKTVGFLYSCFNWFTVKFLDDNRISVFAPEEIERGEPRPLGISSSS